MNAFKATFQGDTKARIRQQFLQPRNLLQCACKTRQLKDLNKMLYMALEVVPIVIISYGCCKLFGLRKPFFFFVIVAMYLNNSSPLSTYRPGMATPKAAFPWRICVYQFKSLKCSKAFTRCMQYENYIIRTALLLHPIVFLSEE